MRKTSHYKSAVRLCLCSSDFKSLKSVHGDTSPSSSHPTGCDMPSRSNCSPPFYKRQNATHIFATRWPKRQNSCEQYSSLHNLVLKLALRIARHIRGHLLSTIIKSYPSSIQPYSQLYAQDYKGLFLES